MVSGVFILIASSSFMLQSFASYITYFLCKTNHYTIVFIIIQAQIYIENSLFALLITGIPTDS